MRWRQGRRQSRSRSRLLSPADGEVVGSNVRQIFGAFERVFRSGHDSRGRAVLSSWNVAQDGRDIEAGSSQFLSLCSLPFLVGVDDALAHVLLQRRGNAERHVAEPAFVNVLAQPAVGLHVPCQLGALSTCIAAKLALVRLLTSVRSPVHRQVRAVLEDLAAELAGVIATAAGDLLASNGVK